MSARTPEDIAFAAHPTPTTLLLRVAYMYYNTEEIAWTNRLEKKTLMQQINSRRSKRNNQGFTLWIKDMTSWTKLGRPLKKL